MMRPLALLSAAGDRVNPIVVREFRQAVQSRLVIAILMLSLLVNLLIMGGYLVLTPETGNSGQRGPEIFLFLLAVLQDTCLVFVPLYAGTRLSLERNDANIDLFFITTITPGAIIRGKYFAAMALTALIYSACMPFITVTYLLRGIDLPTIFAMLAAGFAMCAAANAAGLFIGCIPASWFLRGVVGVGALIALLWLATGALEMAREGVRMGMHGPMNDWRFWAGIGSVLLLEALAIGLLHVFSVAMLSPKTSNRMFVPRLYVMGVWVVTGAMTAAWDYMSVSLWLPYPWVMGSGIAFTLLTWLALGERDALGPRVRKRIPRNRLLRGFAFLLYTGSAGGIAWCAMMLGATILASVAWSVWLLGSNTGWAVWIRDLAELCTNTAIAYGYGLCYCLTVASLRPLLLKKAPSSVLPPTAALLGVALCMIPAFIAFLCNGWEWLPWLLLASPWSLSADNKIARDYVVPVVLGWLALAMLASAPWFLGQWRRFVPYQADQRQPEPRAAVVAPEGGGTSAAIEPQV